MPEKKYIRFIDSDYNTLFHIEDGANIIVTWDDGSKHIRKCRFLDEYHTEIGGECFHICQWAEIMERNGSTYCQEAYITDPEFYPRRYLTPASDKQRPPYYVLDEARGFAVAYAPQGAPGKKYCVFDHIPGERRGEFRVGDYRVFCGSLKTLDPKSWGFNAEKIKAVTGRKLKARHEPER